MKKTLTILLFLVAPYLSYACQNDSDFNYTVNSDCSVSFAPCNSAGFGSWDFGDGNSTSGVQGTTHCYGVGGSYEVTHVFNGIPFTKWVYVNCDPLDFSYTVEDCCIRLEADLPCEANATWEFSDGGSASGGMTEYCFDESGSYTVQLQVANSTKTKTITVSCDDTPTTNECPLGFGVTSECGPLPWETGKPWYYDCQFTYTNWSTMNYLAVFWTYDLTTPSGTTSHSAAGESITLDHFSHYDPPYNYDYQFVSNVCMHLFLPNFTIVSTCTPCHPLSLTADNEIREIDSAVKKASKININLYPSTINSGTELNVRLTNDLVDLDYFEGQIIIMDQYGNMVRKQMVSTTQFAINTYNFRNGVHTLMVYNKNNQLIEQQRFIVMANK